MRVEPLLEIRIGGHGQVDVVGVEPSGDTFRVTVLKNGGRKRFRAAALAGVTDAGTGEIIEHPTEYFRAIWARRICGEKGRWPLPQLIHGLGVTGLGPENARRIASAIGTWDRFIQAIRQLQTIEVPSSRDEIERVRVELAIEQGHGETRSADHHICADGIDMIVRSSVTHLQGAIRSQVLPEPLETLMNEAGPALWRALRKWADTPASWRTVEELLKFGDPAPLERGGPMAGTILVFAGTFVSITRAEARRAVEAAGGEVHGSVSGRTTAVVGGDAADGPKMKRASRLNIPTWTESELLAQLRK